MGGGDPRRYRGPKPPPPFQDDESYSALSRADRTERHNAGTTWSAAPLQPGRTLANVNEAELHWLMAQDAPDEKLTLEDWVAWHQQTTPKGVGPSDYVLGPKAD
jgi:hypothetical protein